MYSIRPKRGYCHCDYHPRLLSPPNINCNRHVSSHGLLCFGGSSECYRPDPYRWSTKDLEQHCHRWWENRDIDRAFGHLDLLQWSESNHIGPNHVERPYHTCKQRHALQQVQSAGLGDHSRCHDHSFGVLDLRCIAGRFAAGSLSGH